MTPITIDIFTKMFQAFDASVLGTINTGSTRIISLISPVMMIGFSIYLLLVCSSYWRGVTDEPIQDFLYRMIGWVVIIALGMNIDTYSEYVVPFFSGAGDDLAAALTGNTNTISSLDNLASAYINTCAQIYNSAHGFDTFAAVWEVFTIGVFGLPFLAIAAAYLSLAKLALAILLALGPLFISLALFPATREYFSRWVGQCANYVFLTCLFGAAATIECNFAATLIPVGGKFDVVAVLEVEAVGMALILVSLNLPSLASQLGGGVGISSMIGKLKSLSPMSKIKSGQANSTAQKSGGNISNKS